MTHLVQLFETDSFKSGLNSGAVFICADLPDADGLSSHVCCGARWQEVLIDLRENVASTVRVYGKAGLRYQCLWDQTHRLNKGRT